MAAAGGWRLLWRPQAELAQAARGVSGAGRAATVRAEELAERLRARKKEREQREQRREGTPGVDYNSRRAPRRLRAVPADPRRRRARALAALGAWARRLHPNVVAKVLREGLVHQDRDMVVVDKPYGLPVHGGPGVRSSVAAALPALGALLGGPGAPPLRLCHRLDKDTTGAMVLARGAEAAARLRRLFRTRQVDKVYWAIAVGQPEPAEGLVDIPVVEKEVRGGQAHFKMTLAPNYRLERAGGREVKVRRRCGAQSAVTRYRVLAAASGCSLLELRPITGAKHQLRVHLAYGLGCPVLGDHKYSHWRKLAPQRLPEAALRRLRLGRAQARRVPLHLHARRLVLPPHPGAAAAAPLELRCPPPAFFRATLRRLRLEPGDADDGAAAAERRPEAPR
ncbi:pseudouridylate synthase RPUSD4, mitochondrial [Eudromia elegans]